MDINKILFSHIGVNEIIVICVFILACMLMKLLYFAYTDLANC